MELAVDVATDGDGTFLCLLDMVHEMRLRDNIPLAGHLTLLVTPLSPWKSSVLLSNLFFHTHPIAQPCYIIL
jgi:hypothetical protein